MRLKHLRPRTREQALTLWSFVGTVLVAVTTWAGVGYATGGNYADTSSSHKVIEALLPGGLRTDGVILLVLALLMAYTVATPFTTSSRWILRVFAGHAFLVGLSFIGSWIVTKEIVWGVPMLWFGIGALAEGLVIFPPSALPPMPEEEESATHDGTGVGSGCSVKGK